MRNTAPHKVESVEQLCSERNVHTLPLPSEGDRALYKCAGPTGFRLMVNRSGRRIFYLNYRARGGPARSYRIGPAEDLSFKEARARAETIRGLVAEGRDPVAEEQAAAKAKKVSRVVTLREAFDYYLAAHRHQLDGKTVKAHEQTRDALPAAFMASPAEEVAPPLFRRAVKEATQAPIMQNRHLSRIKAVLRFAYTEQAITRLPAVLVMKRPNLEPKRDRVLTTDEIRTLWKAVENIAPSMPRGGRAFAASMRIMLLLGTRRGETALSEWGEFDLDGSARRSDAVQHDQPMWYVPAAHRKGELDRKRPHWIPLPSLAVAILRELRSVTSDKPRVFHKAGEQARTYMMNKLLAEMKRLGQPEPFTAHDLRRSCSSWLGEMGCPHEINDLILGHVRKGVIAHYDFSMRLPERAEWLQKWARRVEEITS
jgi:integrase